MWNNIIVEVNKPNCTPGTGKHILSRERTDECKNENGIGGGRRRTACVVQQKQDCVCEQ